MKSTAWRTIPFIVFFILVIFLWRGLSLDPRNLPSTQIGRAVPSFNLPVLGKPKQKFDASQMKGQIVLLNIWASWCASCVEEQAFLMHLAQQNIPIYGLDYKDSSKKAQQWLAQWGNPYQLIGEDKLGNTAIDLGVYGAPETFLVDSEGIIQYRHVGVLDEASWEDEFLPRIQRLRMK